MRCSTAASCHGSRGRPHVAGAPVAADRRSGIPAGDDGVTGPAPRHPPRGSGVPRRRSRTDVGPVQGPARDAVEARHARAQRAEREGVVECRSRPHDRGSVAAPLVRRPRRDGLDVAGRHVGATRAERARDDGPVGEDLAAVLEQDVHPAQRMAPVVVVERSSGPPHAASQSARMAASSSGDRSAVRTRRSVVHAVATTTSARSGRSTRSHATWLTTSAPIGTPIAEQSPVRAGHRRRADERRVPGHEVGAAVGVEAAAAPGQGPSAAARLLHEAAPEELLGRTDEASRAAS